MTLLKVLLQTLAGADSSQGCSPRPQPGQGQAGQRDPMDEVILRCLEELQGGPLGAMPAFDLQDFFPETNGNCGCQAAPAASPSANGNGSYPAASGGPVSPARKPAGTGGGSGGGRRSAKTGGGGSGSDRGARDAGGSSQDNRPAQEAAGNAGAPAGGSTSSPSAPTPAGGGESLGEFVKSPKTTRSYRSGKPDTPTVQYDAKVPTTANVGIEGYFTTGGEDGVTMKLRGAPHKKDGPSAKDYMATIDENGNFEIAKEDFQKYTKKEFEDVETFMEPLGDMKGKKFGMKFESVNVENGVENTLYVDKLDGNGWQPAARVVDSGQLGDAPFMDGQENQKSQVRYDGKDFQPEGMRTYAVDGAGSSSQPTASKAEKSGDSASKPSTAPKKSGDSDSKPSTAPKKSGDSKKK